MNLSQTNIRWIAPGIYEVMDFFPVGVRAVQTTRVGGVSTGAFSSMNLARHVGDDPARVRTNRMRLEQAIGASVFWLNQVHGITSHRIDPGAHANDVCTADAAYTTQTGSGSAVMTADCLPVLISTADGRWVGAAHAGWRGLSQGVIEGLLDQIATQYLPGPLDAIFVWLGPAIGAQAFEVGGDVLKAFAATQNNCQDFFRPSGAHPDRYLADLHGLAESRVQHWAKRRGGIDVRLRADRVCVFLEQEHFYSFRRERTTGRMASIIYRTEI